MFLVLVWALSSHAFSALSRRGLSQDDLSAVVGALLFKNSRQTTCEVALFDMKSGLLSANCLDFADDTSLDQSTSYEIYVTSGTDNKESEVYKLELDDIHVHPYYNHTSLENNAAVVEFNKNTTSTYEAYIYSGTFPYSDAALVRRSYDQGKGEWNDPDMIPMPSDDRACSGWNELYNLNSKYSACNVALDRSMFNTLCSVPYGSLYAKANNSTSILALYSSSVIFSTDTCSGSNRWLNYYPFIDTVISFAAVTLNRPIKYTNSSGVYQASPTEIQEIVHNDLPPIDFSDKTLVGGDIYGIRDEQYTPQESTLDSRSASQEASSSDSSSSDSSGLTNTQVLAIAITIPLVVVCITVVLGLLYYRHLKDKRAENKDDDWDPYAERLNMREMANELGGADEPIRPPSYNEAIVLESSPSLAGPSTEIPAHHSQPEKGGKS
ncbi:hypothetical protein EV183_002534 [Coemansia sp. RSA 2336]|nr:hypothetical protein EV183_002534 [Coemansia sp. RSA 2336]